MPKKTASKGQKKKAASKPELIDSEETFTVQNAGYTTEDSDYEPPMERSDTMPLMAPVFPTYDSDMDPSQNTDSHDDDFSFNFPQTYQGDSDGEVQFDLTKAATGSSKKGRKKKAAKKKSTKKKTWKP